MKSLFLAAVASFAIFSSAPARAQQYHESYYRDSHSGAAHVVGALINIAAHSSHDRRSNYYGGNGYVRDPRYSQYNYAPRYRSFDQHNRHNGYSGYPSYRQRHHYQSHHGHHGRHHGRRH